MEVLINGIDYTNKVSKGFPIEEAIQEELDSATLCLLLQQITNFPKFAKVQITIGTKIFKYVIMESMYDRTRTGYFYTINAIEYTKILENIVVDGLAMTTGASLYDQILRTSTKITYSDAYIDVVTGFEPITHGIAFTFHLSVSEMQLLEGAPSEEFVFSGLTNSREIFDEMLMSVDREIRVSDITYNEDGSISSVELSLDYPNNKLSNVSANINKALEWNVHKDADYETMGIVSSVKNVVSSSSITEPYQTYKGSEDAVYSTNDACIITNYDINEVKQLVAKFDVTYSFPYRYWDIDTWESSSIVRTTTIEYDFSSCCVEKSIYDAKTQIEKRSLVYYSKGDRAIQSFRKLTECGFLNLDSSETLDYMFENVKSSIKASIANDLDGMSFQYDAGGYNGVVYFDKDSTDLTITIAQSSYSEVKWKVKYNPIVDMHIEAQKDNSSITLKKLKTIVNQGSSSVDIKRYVNNLNSQIKRLGNNQIEMSFEQPTIDDLFNLGDYCIIDSKEYRIDKREFSYVDDNTAISVKYRFCEGFNAINEQIKIKREKRFYSIPVNDYIKHVININWSQAITSPNNDPANFKNINLITSALPNSKSLNIPLVSYYDADNSTYYLTAETVDNYGCGFQVKKINKKKVTSNTPYCDSDGKFTSMEISLFGDILSSFDSTVLPVIDTANGDSWNSCYGYNNPPYAAFNYEKDPFEQIVISIKWKVKS